MATKTAQFQTKQLGITAFLAANRVDFVLDGPAMEKPARVSAFADKPSAKLTLDGKALKIVGSDVDEAGEPVKLEIKWGKEVLKLGRRKDASGPVSFYRSLETASSAAAPKTAEQITNLLALFTA